MGPIRKGGPISGGTLWSVSISYLAKRWNETCWHLKKGSILTPPQRQGTGAFERCIMRASGLLSPSDLLLRSQPRPTRQDKERADDEHRSNYNSVPGDEFPVAIYRSIVIAFAG